LLGEVGWEGGGDDFGGDLMGLLRTNLRAQTCFPLMENLALLLPSRTPSMEEAKRTIRRA